jgi:tetratricopeptide (TPR) repeat protein
MPTEEQLLEIHRLALLGAEVDIARNVNGRLADSWLGLSRFREVRELCTKTLELGQDPDIFVSLAWAKDVLGEVAEAMRLYRDARKMYEEVGDRAGLAATLNNIGLVYRSTGQPDKVLEHYHQALPIMVEVGNRSGQATTLNNIGLVYDNTGQPEQALKYYQQALPIREEVGDRAGIAQTLNNIGLVYDNTGQPEQALEYYQQALPIRVEVGDRAGESVTRYNLAMIYRAQGKLREAVEELKQVVELDELVQSPDLESDRAVLVQVQEEIGAS